MIVPGSPTGQKHHRTQKLQSLLWDDSTAGAALSATGGHMLGGRPFGHKISARTSRRVAVLQKQHRCRQQHRGITATIVISTSHHQPPPPLNGNLHNATVVLVKNLITSRESLQGAHAAAHLMTSPRGRPNAKHRRSMLPLYRRRQGSLS